MRIFSLFLLVLSLFAIPAQSLQTTVSPAFRLYPMAGDLTVLLKQEGLFYDHRNDKDPLSYGMWQVTLLGDVTGSVEVGFNYYPISFVKIEAGAGGTYRYFNNPTFNCTLVNCSGFLARNRIGISFMGATGANNEWLINPEYNLMMVSAAQSSLPIGDDSEVIAGAPNSDTLDRYQVILGKKVESQVYGFMYRQARYRSSGQHNELQSLVYKSEWRDTSFMMGAGRYASDLDVPGIAFFAVYEWHWGYSQALF